MKIPIDRLFFETDTADIDVAEIYQAAASLLEMPINALREKSLLILRIISIMKMENWQDRTQLLIGEQGIERLKNSHVLVVGLGGVGAYAAEQLARAGIGKMTIVDGDTVSVTNRNRQLLALQSTFGRPKAEVMAERIRDINPEVELEVINQYMKDEAIIELVSKPYDFIVDAIDTVAPKVFLLYYAKQNNQRIVSCMGAGGKYHPEKSKLLIFRNRTIAVWHFIFANGCIVLAFRMVSPWYSLPNLSMIRLF